MLKTVQNYLRKPEWNQFHVGGKGLYLMLRLMCAGLEPLFLVPVRVEGGEGLWLAGLERGLDAGWEGGGWAGVSPEGEVDGGGVHCHAAESPPCASFSELKGALWDWSV